MRLSRRSALLLRLAVAVGLAFIYIPLIIIFIYAFNASHILEWPPPGLTLRFVTLPSMRTALAAGALLAFALSFDEIIVTTFTIGAGEETLPIWIFSRLFRPNQLPIVNVVAVLVVLISIVPVYLAHRLTREEGGVAVARGGRGRRIEGGGVETEATAVP